MKRTLPVIISVVLAFTASPAVLGESASARPLENIHYRVAENLVEENRAVHFFSFGCHHCYRFDPIMEAWSEENDITIKRIPVSFGKKQWDHYAKLFFALQILTGADDFTGRLFQEIHANRNKSLSVEDLQSVLNLSDVQQDRLIRLYRSAEVERALQNAKQLAKKYAITGVPAMVVEGRYVTDAALARGIHGLIGVVDYLASSDPADI